MRETGAGNGSDAGAINSNCVKIVRVASIVLNAHAHVREWAVIHGVHVGGRFGIFYK